MLSSEIVSGFLYIFMFYLFPSFRVLFSFVLSCVRLFSVELIALRLHFFLALTLYFRSLFIAFCKCLSLYDLFIYIPPSLHLVLLLFPSSSLNSLFVVCFQKHSPTLIREKDRMKC